MKKRQNTYRLTEKSEKWLKDKAEKTGISKNNYLQIIVSKAMIEDESEETQ